MLLLATSLVELLLMDFLFLMFQIAVRLFVGPLLVELIQAVSLVGRGYDSWVAGAPGNWTFSVIVLLGSCPWGSCSRSSISWSSCPRDLC